MSFMLRLHITGLCAIIPVGGSYMIVLPNARDYDDQGVVLDPTAEPERHIALLGVQAGRSQAQGRNSFLIPASSGLMNFDLQAYPLNKEDLDLEPVFPLAVALRPAPSSQCPDDVYPVNDFAWITRMSDVNAAKANPIVTAGAFPGSLALARLMVTSGIWKTEALASSPIRLDDPTKYNIRWYYADMNGNPLQPTSERVIADVTEVDIPIAGDTAAFASSLSGRNITISGGSDVDVCLANVPLSTLLGSPPPSMRVAEMHFSHFYRLAMDTPPRYVPWPDIAGQNCGPSGSGTELSPHCPPTLFGA
jgi:hypothetical protein